MPATVEQQRDGTTTPAGGDVTVSSRIVSALLGSLQRQAPRLRYWMLQLLRLFQLLVCLLLLQILLLLLLFTVLALVWLFVVSLVVGGPRRALAQGYHLSLSFEEGITHGSLIVQEHGRARLLQVTMREFTEGNNNRRASLLLFTATVATAPNAAA